MSEVSTLHFNLSSESVRYHERLLYKIGFNPLIILLYRLESNSDLVVRGSQSQKHLGDRSRLSEPRRDQNRD
jgi:hypothetical protein